MDNPAVVTSAVALLLSGLSLGWNIFRDVVLRARVRVRAAVVHLVSPGEDASKAPSFVRLAVTNHGPGPVEIVSIGGMHAPLWRRLVRKAHHFVVLPDHSNPLSARLPRRLEVGETADLLLPYGEQSFLNTDATHIGVYDSFGRMHYATKTLTTAKQQFRKDHPKAITRRIGAD